MRQLLKIVYPIAFIMFISIWGFLALNIDKSKDGYSPLDSYVKASNKSYNSNLKAENDAKSFIDSLNNSHK